ncbi:MAG TPA: DUF2403 domain-containing protein [Polyangiaceae bacterium]|nr:DUF2403 domain-containing protein [Polyangiaceae bacterium]
MIRRRAARWIGLGVSLVLVGVAACSNGDENTPSSGAGTGASTTGATGATGGASAGNATGGSNNPSGGSSGTTSTAATGGTTVTAGNGGTANPGGTAGTGGLAVPVGEGDLGPAEYAAGELDAPSDGATITYQDVGGAGWYPSRRDPGVGPCDVTNANGCCMAQHDLATDQLTPWNEELSMTLRGPMLVKQIVAYQPGAADTWARVSAWDSRGTSEGLAFWGSGAEGTFDGRIGSVCEAEVAPDLPYPCGSGSVPFCPEGDNKYYGFAGSKLIVVLAWNPHTGTGVLDDVACDGETAGWHDAPWIGLTHGELVRSGRYSGCHCWSKAQGSFAQDGCGQFNVFEVVNDNNDFANFDIFSTNLVSYAGYIGEGPCGNNCDASGLPATSDLLNKNGGGNTAATAGVVSGPGLPTGAAFVRPAAGFRYFVILLDESSRTVQIGLVHPSNIPASVAALLPNFPLEIPRATIDAVLGLRLPN